MVYLLKEASAEVTANLHIHKEVVEDPATRNTFFKLKYHSSKSNSDVINDAWPTVFITVHMIKHKTLHKIHFPHLIGSLLCSFSVMNINKIWSQLTHFYKSSGPLHIIPFSAIRGGGWLVEDMQFFPNACLKNTRSINQC